jgi:hypothetical protein
LSKGLSIKVLQDWRKPIDMVKYPDLAQHRWPMPVILATWEAEIRRIEV